MAQVLDRILNRQFLRLFGRLSVFDVVFVPGVLHFRSRGPPLGVAAR
jgi:hypothetical protein